MCDRPTYQCCSGAAGRPDIHAVLLQSYCPQYTPYPTRPPEVSQVWHICTIYTTTMLWRRVRKRRRGESSKKRRRASFSLSGLILPPLLLNIIYYYIYHHTNKQKIFKRPCIQRAPTTPTDLSIPSRTSCG